MEKKKTGQKEIVKLSIELLDRVETVEEIENILGVKITKETLSLIGKELNNRKRKSAAAKRKYAAIGNRELVAEQKAANKKLDLTYQKFLQLRQQVYSGSTDTKSERELLIQNIEESNCWLDKEDKLLFDTYLTSKVHGDRIDILRELTSRYLENVGELLDIELYTTKNIEGMEEEHKSPVRKHLMPWTKTMPPTKEMYHPYEEKLKEIINRANQSKAMIKFLQRLEEIESIELSKVDRLEITTEELLEKREFIIPTNEIEERYQKFLQYIDKGNYRTSLISSLQNSLPEEVITLLNEMKSLPRFQLDEMITLAKHLIKNKRNQIGKSDTNAKDTEKRFLKQLEIAFENIRPQIYLEEEDTKAYFDILQVLLNDDRNYEYIKKLLEIDEFKNARQAIKIKEGKGRKKVRITEKKHVTLYILDQFIKNYKLKLQNQKKEYIEPSYYKEILKQFIKQGAKLTSKELMEYNQRLDEFREYIKGKGYQNTNQVLEDINEINYIRPISKSKRMSKQPQQIEYKEERYQFALDIGVEQNKNHDYPEFIPSDIIRTFQIEGLEPYAFSIEYQNDGSRKIGVHVLDTTKIINENPDFLNDIKEENEQVPRLDTTRIYPTYSFQTGIGNDNELYHGEMTPSNILIQTYFNEEDQQQYRNYPELKEMANWLRLLQINIEAENNEYFEGSMKDLISRHLSRKISTRLEAGKVPFIYKAALPDQEKLIEKNHNNTCDILFKIPKPTAHRIYDILDQKESTATYYIPNKTKLSKIETDSMTLEGTYLLETLHRIQEQRYNPDEASEEIKILLQELNSNHEYVPSCLSSHNDRQVDRMIKIYKRNKKGQN